MNDRDMPQPLQEVYEALTLAAEYFDDRADCDMDQDGYVPNREKVILDQINYALGLLDQHVN